MKNRSALGKRLEGEVKEILTSEGWLVEQAIPKTIFIGPGKMIAVAHDFFGLFDLIAVRPNGFAAQVKFVQVTVWEETARKRKKLEESAFDWTKLDCDIYARMRDVSPIHYRVLQGMRNWIWEDVVKYTVKKERTNGKNND